MKKKLLVFVLGLGLCTAGCEGPDGDPGPQGPVGPQGEQGVVGADGANGSDGKDAPNRTFYFQEGFKGYSGTRDNYISPNSPGNQYGSLEYLQVRHDATSPSEVFVSTLMRFENISESILAQLDDTGTAGCEEDFYVNEAILYVYAYTAKSTFTGDLRLKVDFYGESDPIFAESTSTWLYPNEVQNWNAEGGDTFGDWDTEYLNYTTSLPQIDGHTDALGWVGIPIPRQIVKKWICDPDNWNKGMRIRIEGDAAESEVGYFYMRSKEYDVVDLRPLLYINGEPASGSEGAKIYQKTWEEQLKEWEMKPFADQMAPLHKRLNIK